jgi:hypothetical protein
MTSSLKQNDTLKIAPIGGRGIDLSQTTGALQKLNDVPVFG